MTGTGSAAIRKMKRLSCLLITVIVLTAPATMHAGEKGILTGGQKYDLPDWFAHGFLEFQLEVSEANETGKQILCERHHFYDRHLIGEKVCLFVQQKYW